MSKPMEDHSTERLDLIPDSSDLPLDEAMALPGKRSRKSKPSARPAPKGVSSLTAYFREVSGYKILTREDEIALGQELGAARKTILGALLSSPPALSILLGWYDQIESGETSLK